MKHCSNCHYSVIDGSDSAWYQGLIGFKCRLKGHILSRPFFSGFGCRRWRPKVKGKYAIQKKEIKRLRDYQRRMYEEYGNWRSKWV